MVNSEAIIGILAPMDVEACSLVESLQDKEKIIIGQRVFYTGTLEGKKVVLGISFMGKISAAICATILIEHFNVDKIICIGICGGLISDLKMGDVVIANKLVQHDVDATPLCKKFVLPPYKDHIPCDKNEVENARNKIDALMKNIYKNRYKVFEGLIISGDQFVSSIEAKDNLMRELPDAIAVDMETFSVGAVCTSYNIPFLIFKLISDESGDDNVDDSIMDYTQESATKVIDKIVKALI